MVIFKMPTFHQLYVIASTAVTNCEILMSLLILMTPTRQKAEKVALG